MHFFKKTLLILSLFSFVSCTNNVIDDNQNNNDNSNNDDSNNNDDENNGEEPKEVSFSEAVQNTINNYSFEETYKEVDNLNPSDNHFGVKKVQYNNKEEKMLIAHNTIFTSDENVFNTYKDDESYFSTNIYYKNDQGQIICRFKNRGEDSVWDDMNYTSSNQDVFSTQLINYIVPEHFTLNEEDKFYYLNNEFLDSEEASRLAGYYGSYQYLEQKYDYIAFSVKDGHLDQYKMSVHFVSRPGNSFQYDAVSETTGSFDSINSTSIKLPDLPIYHEDTLIEDENLVKAQEKAKNNYTYNETVTIIDNEGNEDTKKYTEQVDGDSFRYYFYSYDANCYSDSYTYTVYKNSFNGSTSASTHETCIFYYDDYTDYQDYDMDILDDSVSSIANLGGKYGIKVFEFKEDDSGSYYTPSREKPTRYNPNDYTYLDYAASSFIHGIVGNYVSSDGRIYSYKFNDLRFYLDENGDFYKTTYSFDMEYTKNDVTRTYHVVGNGQFSEIGKTKIIVPSNPNDDIVLDDRLSRLYSAINSKNYSYKEKYQCFDSSENLINFSKEENRVEETMYYNEYVDNNKVKQEATCNVIVDYDSSENPIYRFATLNDYYYFGEEAFYNYYTFDDFYTNDRYYYGEYNYSGVIDKLKENLKYFKFSNTKTINGESVDVFKLTPSYLRLFGKDLVISASSNKYASVTSLLLYVKDEKIVRINYAYDNYDGDKNYIGICEGTINIDFNETNIEVPNVNLSIVNNTIFEDTMNSLSNKSYKHDVTSNVSCFSNRTSCSAFVQESMNIRKIDASEKDCYYYDENNNLIAKYNDADGVKNIKIVPFNSIDFSKFNRNDFVVDGANNYNLKEEKFAEYFNNVFNFDENVEIKPMFFSLSIKDKKIEITYQYHLRYKTSAGNYALYYINGTIKIS